MSDHMQPPFSILFVDDDEMSRNHFARAIGADYSVHVAPGADEAMAVLSRHGSEIAVLVTDFRMPGVPDQNDLAALVGITLALDMHL